MEGYEDANLPQSPVGIDEVYQSVLKAAQSGDMSAFTPDFMVFPPTTFEDILAGTPLPTEFDQSSDDPPPDQEQRLGSESTSASLSTMASSTAATTTQLPLPTEDATAQVAEEHIPDDVITSDDEVEDYANDASSAEDQVPIHDAGNTAAPVASGNNMEGTRAAIHAANPYYTMITHWGQDGLGITARGGESLLHPNAQIKTKLMAEFPSPMVEIPADVTLYGIIQYWANHLCYEGLDPFIQIRVSGREIHNQLPASTRALLPRYRISNVGQGQGQGKNIANWLEHRLGNRKDQLGKQRQYALQNAPLLRQAGFNFACNARKVTLQDLVDLGIVQAADAQEPVIDEEPVDVDDEGDDGKAGAEEGCEYWNNGFDEEEDPAQGEHSSEMSSPTKTSAATSRPLLSPGIDAFTSVADLAGNPTATVTSCNVSQPSCISLADLHLQNVLTTSQTERTVEMDQGNFNPIQGGFPVMPGYGAVPTSTGSGTMAAPPAQTWNPTSQMAMQPNNPFNASVTQEDVLTFYEGNIHPLPTVDHPLGTDGGGLTFWDNEMQWGIELDKYRVQARGCLALAKSLIENDEELDRAINTQKMKTLLALVTRDTIPQAEAFLAALVQAFGQTHVSDPARRQSVAFDAAFLRTTPSNFAHLLLDACRAHLRTKYGEFARTQPSIGSWQSLDLIRGSAIRSIMATIANRARLLSTFKQLQDQPGSNWKISSALPEVFGLAGIDETLLRLLLSAPRQIAPAVNPTSFMMPAGRPFHLPTTNVPQVAVQTQPQTATFGYGPSLRVDGHGTMGGLEGVGRYRPTTTVRPAGLQTNNDPMLTDEPASFSYLPHQTFPYPENDMPYLLTQQGYPSMQTTTPTFASGLVSYGDQSAINPLPGGTDPFLWPNTLPSTFSHPVDMYDAQGASMDSSSMGFGFDPSPNYFPATFNASFGNHAAPGASLNSSSMGFGFDPLPNALPATFNGPTGYGPAPVMHQAGYGAPINAPQAPFQFGFMSNNNGVSSPVDHARVLRDSTRPPPLSAALAAAPSPQRDRQTHPSGDMGPPGLKRIRNDNDEDVDSPDKRLRQQSVTRTPSTSAIEDLTRRTLFPHAIGRNPSRLNADARPFVSQTPLHQAAVVNTASPHGNAPHPQTLPSLSDLFDAFIDENACETPDA